MVTHIWIQEREIEDMINKEKVWMESMDYLACQDSQVEISLAKLSLKKGLLAQAHWRLTLEEGMEGMDNMVEMVEKGKKAKKQEKIKSNKLRKEMKKC